MTALLSPAQGAYCGQCSERIWGLARQGYRCISCRLLVHKRCHGLVPLTCKRHMVSGARPGAWDCRATARLVVRVCAQAGSSA